MHEPAPGGRLAVVYAVTVFVSAFLLFQVQPLVGKAILPWFGGTPGVWTMCLLFFQVVLFAGYLYAHVLTSRCPLRVQAGMHALLLAGGLLTLHVLPDRGGAGGGAAPGLRVLALLAGSVGLPYFLLSTTGPLLQRWFSLTCPGLSPYRLYSLSNAGSLLALLTYPFVFEPLLPVTAQARGWTAAFCVFAVLSAGCAATVVRMPAGAPSSADLAGNRPSVDRPARGLFVMWFGLSLVGSALLLAITNQVCLDVAVVPFLWVVPLSLYLLSFILCFESDRWYRRRPFAVATTIGVLAVCWLLVKGGRTAIVLQAPGYFATLFCACMLCHGELARLRPPVSHLTAFYLTISAGGAAGGLLVGLAAPLIFPAYWELHVALLACLLIALVAFADACGWFSRERGLPILYLVCAVPLIAAVGTVFTEAITDYRGSVAMTRNFYGVLQVQEVEEDGAAEMQLQHGRILHGLQMRDPDERSTPTTYYGTQSGVGRVMAALHRRQGALRIGAVGLGTGTIATYGRTGDTFRFYEINADVERLARKHFTFLADSAANVETVLGDARLSLESEPPQEFDLLVLDAFSSDAIPTHLLTREAMQVYLRHLKSVGYIALHISNLHFDLRPVADALAEACKLEAIALDDPGTESHATRSNSWVIFARDPDLLRTPEIQEAAIEPQARRTLWTDDYSNLVGVLQWKP
jgi:hypothetical protein